MGLGLLLSAISGGANSASAAMTEQQKVQDQMDMDAAKGSADLQRQQAMSKFNLNLANTNQADQSAQLQSATQGLLNSQTEANVNQLEGNEPGSADYVPLSAMSAEEKSQGSPDPLAIMLQAGAQTGQLSAANIATLTAQLSAGRTAAAQEALRELTEQHRSDQAASQLAEDHRSNLASEAADRASGGSGTSKVPTEVLTAQWLAANADNPKAMAAYDKMNQGSTKPIISIAADMMSKNPDLSAADAISKAGALYNPPKSPAILTFDPSTGTFK